VGAFTGSCGDSQVSSTGRPCPSTERARKCVSGLSGNRARSFQVVGAVEEWLVEDGIDTAELSIGNRSYILVAPAPIGSNL
jgi:hypothetical protein